MPDAPPAVAHATMDTAAFDATKEHCTRDIVFFWQSPSCFSKWTPSRFTVDGISYSCGEQFFVTEKSRLFGDHRHCNTSCACPTLAFTSNTDEKSVTSISPCGNASEKKLCLSALAPSSPKIQSCNHISWTRSTGFSRKLALTTSYGESDTGLTTSLHASRPYGAA